MFIKMKKYLFSLLAIPLLFIGCYSSAYVESQEYTVSCSGGSCKPTTINRGNNYWVIIKSASSTNCAQLIFNVWQTEQTLYPYYSTNELVNFEDFIMSSNSFQVSAMCWITDWNIKFVLVSPDPPIIEWWVSTFTPIITGLTGSINEFIPYVVYISLWVLWVLISFVAIKRLINWVRAKIFSSFK